MEIGRDEGGKKGREEGREGRSNGKRQEDRGILLCFVEFCFIVLYSIPLDSILFFVLRYIDEANLLYIIVYIKQ